MFISLVDELNAQIEALEEVIEETAASHFWRPSAGRVRAVVSDRYRSEDVSRRRLWRS